MCGWPARIRQVVIKIEKTVVGGGIVLGLRHTAQRLSDRGARVFRSLAVSVFGCCCVVGVRLSRPCAAAQRCRRCNPARSCHYVRFVCLSCDARRVHIPWGARAAAAAAVVGRRDELLLIVYALVQPRARALASSMCLFFSSCCCSPN